MLQHGRGLDMTEEQRNRYLTEILDGNDRGDFNDPKHPKGNYTYGHLLALLEMRGKLDGVEELYRSLYNYTISCGKNAILKKAENHKKIRVIFLLYSASTWSAESLYRLLKKDDRFDVKILLSPLADRSINDIKDTYYSSKEYFEKNDYDLIAPFDAEKMTVLAWDSIGGIPDLIIHGSTWNECLPEIYQFFYFPLTVLNAYIPYSMDLGNSTDGSYTKDYVYNKDFINLMWRVYCESSHHMAGFREYELLQGENVRFSGYVKLDPLYQNNSYSDNDLRKLWSIPADTDINTIKKVIVAPHYSIFDNGSIRFSTFRRNAWFLLYLAEKYRDCISFIYKPHPNLRMAAVQTGLFHSYEEYDEYLKKWNELPNAKIVTEATYMDHFKTSDALILDSISFIGEYLYTGKPALFLRRSTQNFGELGQKIVNSYYQANGEEYAKIDDYLQNVVLAGIDPMKDRRKAVFEKELDYYHQNQSLAGEYVYKDLKGLIVET